MTDPVFAATGAPVANGWQDARIVAIRPETARATTFRLALSQPVGHLPGQHYIVRLVAADGYRAQRSYSIASAPDGSGEIELTVERLDGGEVSGFLHDTAAVGDVVIVRGPVGGYFVWNGTAPAVLVGGGSGVVPLMSMLRHARALGRHRLVHLVASARTVDDLLYRGELVGAQVTVVCTRGVAPSGRPPGRLAPADLPPVDGDVTGFVCGADAFAEHAGRLLIDAGLPAGRIKVERFGPTG